MSDHDKDVRLRCPQDDFLLWKDVTEGHYHCDKCKGVHRPAEALPDLVLSTLRVKPAGSDGLRCHQCDVLMELLQIEELDAFIYRCQACQVYWLPSKGANILRRRGTQIATGEYFDSLNESEKSRFVHALCELTPDENIDDLETQLWSSLRLQIKPEKTPVDLVVTPILSFIMLIMMYLPTDGRNISGTDLSAPDVSLYTTLVALFRLPGVFSLALFFFLMSAVEQRIPRWLHLTGLASLAGGFLVLGHLGSEGSRVQGGSLFMVYAVVLCLVLFPRSTFQTFKHIRLLDCPAWLLGAAGLLIQILELWGQPMIYPLWVVTLSVLVALGTVVGVKWLSLLPTETISKTTQ